MGQLRTVLMWFSSSYIDKWKHRNVGFSLRRVFAFIYFIQLHMRGLLVDSLKTFEEIKWFPSWVFRVMRGTLNVKVSCLLMCSCFFLYFFLSESIRGSFYIWPTDIYGMPFDIFFLPFLFSFSFRLPSFLLQVTHDEFYGWPNSFSCVIHYFLVY